MTKSQFDKFLRYLHEKNLIFAPQKINGELKFELVRDIKKVRLTNELPLHSFKKFLAPPDEFLYKYKNNKIDSKEIYSNQVIFGLTIPDLKALAMLNQVFANDPNYQERMEKTLIVGHSLVPDEDYQFFIENFQEDTLEHLKFDVFLAVKKNSFKIFSGSEDGQRVLKSFGYKNYRHIEFVGPIKESGPDPIMLKIKEAMEKFPEHQIWEELGKICIECGKCTIVCPTCFCFDMYDELELKAGEGQKKRRWGACFYTDFSEVAGEEIDGKKPKFLQNTAQRIRFWYEHKFVRIPHEFSIPGCVGCGRCTKVCPVGIDIKKNLQRLLKGRIQ